MFFINRYQIQYIDFRETLKEIKSWSFDPSKKAVVNKIDKFLFLDDTSKNILLAKLSHILKNWEQYLDVDDLNEINLFLKRRLGIKDDILNKKLIDYPQIEGLFTDSIPLNNGNSYVVFNDPLFMTVIEVVLVFIKDNYYKKIQKEFLNIFNKNTNLLLQEYLVFFNTLPDLKNLLHLIKDHKLRNLLKNYYINEHKKRYQESAKSAADIVKYIFFPKPTEKKDRIVGRILDKSFFISKKRTKERELLKQYFEARFDFVVSVIDKVYNIRHTENWTIDVKDPYVYKTIANTCIDFITLYIKADSKKFFTSLPKTSMIRKIYYEEFGREKRKEINIDAIDELVF